MRRVLALLCLLAWPALATAQDATTSGSLTAPAQTVTLTLSRYGSASVQVTGAWTGTLTWQASIDATNYFAVAGVRAGGAGTSLSTTVNDTVTIPVAGYTRVRVLASALSAGTAVVTVRATDPGWGAPVAALDNSAFAFGATTVGALGAVVDDTGTNTVAENSAGAIRMSTSRVAYSNLRDSTGAKEVSLDTNAAPPLFGDYGLFTRALTYARNTSNVYVEDSLTASAPSVSSDWRVTRNVPPTDYEVDTLTVPTDRARFFVNDATNGIGVETCLARVRATTGTGTLRLYGRINADIDIDAFNLDTLRWVDGNSLPTDNDYSYLIPCAGFQEVTIEAPTLTAGTFTITWSAGPGGNIPWRANVDNGAFTFGVANATASGGVVDDTAPNAVTENSSGAFRMSTRRELYSQIRDAAGNERGVNVSAANALKVDGSAVTQPVSLASTTITGTVTVSDPTFTDATGTAVPANAAFVAGTDGTNTRALKTDAAGELQVDVLTLPNVTIGSALPAGTNNIGDVDVLTLPNVTISTFPDNEPFNLNQVAGAAVSTAASGVQKVGIVGNAGATVDAANNAAMPANALAQGVQTATIDTSPTAATAGNLRYQLGSTEGVTYVQEGGPKRFSCFVALTATATTQCQAAPAAGLRNYVTSVSMSNGAATAQTVDIVFGTGAACVTGITALTHKWQFGTLATTTNQQDISQTFPTPLVPTAATAICVRPSAATAFGATITGYIAP